MKIKSSISVIFLLIFIFFSYGVAEAQVDSSIWIRTGGPLGGLGYDVRMHPHNPEIMFVTDAYAGVFKSIDGGKTWYPSNNGIESIGGPSGDAIPIFSLTIDQNNPDIIWVGLQNVRGIYKSIDTGESWVKMDNGVIEYEGITFRGFSIDPRSSDIVYAAAEISTFQSGKEFDKTEGVVYKTTDGGLNWSPIWYGHNLARYIWINYDYPEILYVSTGIFDREAANSDHLSNIPGGVGIIKSIDGGLTWEQKNNGISNLYIGTLFMHPHNPEILLAGSANNVYYEGAGVFLTTNGGDSWTKVLNDGVQSVEFSVSNPEVGYAGNPRNVYKTIDGGYTWDKVSIGTDSWGPPGIVAGFPIDFQIDPRNPDRLFANNYGGGNFLSEDGGVHWISASDGYTGAQVRDISVPNDNPWCVYAAARSGMFVSYDGGENWEGRCFGIASGLEWNAVEVDPENPFHIVASNNWICSILESYDGAETWTDLHVNLPFGNSWRVFKFAPSDLNIIYAGTGAFFSAGSHDPNIPGKGIYVSTNRGAIWEEANDINSKDAHVTDIDVDPINSDIVYTATTNNGLLKSTNGGNTWNVLDEGLPINPSVSSVVVNPSNSLQIFIGLEGAGIYRSYNGGINWEQVTAGFAPEANITSIIFHPENNQIIFAADLASGVYCSNDCGDTWQQINNGLRTRAVNKLAISFNGQFLYAATEGEGVFRLNLVSGPVNVKYLNFISKHYHLKQNYPNPFNPITTIIYQIPNPSADGEKREMPAPTQLGSNLAYRQAGVKLIVYDILGREVATLVNEKQKPGNYEVEFDGSKLTSGIYFYRLRVYPANGGADDYVETRKMILLR